MKHQETTLSAWGSKGLTMPHH